MLVACRRGDLDARRRLIEGHLPLVEMLARRFAHRGEDVEDLVQVGTVGLILAVDRFELDRQVELTTFAVPTIVGEIRRHLRDRSATIRVPRRVQEQAARVRGRERELTARFGRAPTAVEVARAAGLAEAEVRGVLAPAAAAPLSLADTMDDAPLVDAYDAIEDRVLLGAGLRALAPRERTILHLRFVRELSQAQIAKELGISQVHVSRLLRAALETLRTRLADQPPASAELERRVA